MNLLLSSLAQLQMVYGTKDLRRIMLAIEELVQARANQGIATRMLLAEVGMAEYGIAGDATDPAAIAAQVAAVAHALEQAGDQLESVLIVGGPAVIPFDLAPNPIADDGDASIPSDTLYSVREPGALLPDWSVGRLPGAEGRRANADLLVKLLLQAAILHGRKQQTPFAKTFGYSTAVWREAAAQVYAELSGAPLLVSPPTVGASLDVALLDGADAVYCNLHGVRDGPVWYGQADGAQGYLLALRVEDVRRARLSGALVLSEACYGALVAERSEQSSLALTFLDRGAACFVGATAMSYGPANTPLSEADLLALHFWRAARQGGGTIGQAFLQARTHMLHEMLARQPMLDDDDRKTALEFVLYGDPTLKLH